MARPPAIFCCTSGFAWETVRSKGPLGVRSDFCPKHFSKQRHATEHERTHTGEKPYACSMCPVWFADKSAVARHERAHTRCMISPTHARCAPAGSATRAMFPRTSHVPPHERSHAGEKHYGCFFCDKSFTRGRKKTEAFMPA